MGEQTDTKNLIQASNKDEVSAESQRGEPPYTSPSY